jgi:AcrR family transcriptional regulator
MNEPGIKTGLTRRQNVVEERREQILDGALQVFSTRGFIEATNKDIAEAAGINSPGLIYHYFKDKADLLQAVMERFAPPLQILAHASEIKQLPPEEALPRIARLYLGLLDNPLGGAVLKVMIGQMLREPEFARILANAGPIPILKFLSEYLEAQMEKGVFRRTDPDIAARCFIGPLMVQVLGTVILNISEITETPREKLIAQTVETFLRGMAHE